LLDRISEAEKWLKKAESLKAASADATNIRILIYDDLSKIRERYPENHEIRNRVAEFRSWVSTTVAKQISFFSL
jgi:hypothetical protein